MYFFFFFPDESNNLQTDLGFNDVDWQNSANKGEWSELYALYKLLVDQNLFPVNKCSTEGEQLRLPILSILRYTDKNLGAEYRIDDGGVICITPNGRDVVKIEQKQLCSIVTKLFEFIKKGSNKAAFEIPSLEEFRQLTFCPKIKCYSQKLPGGETDKSDIYIVMHDSLTGQNPKLGFSIKSEIGSPPTLLNATKLTRFCYKLSKNLPDEKVNSINSMLFRGKADIRGRVRAILQEGVSLNYTTIIPSKTGDCVFLENLILIDSFLPQIIAHLLLLSYSENSRLLNVLTDKLTEMNPLCFPMKNNKMLYEAKVKHFISDVALGMIPSQPWSGVHLASGILVVKESGALDCYHVIYQSALEDYLYHDLKFETPDVKRHRFGSIEYGKDGCQYFSLNLQLRFVK